MPLLRNGQWAKTNPWIRIDDDQPLAEIVKSDAPKVLSMPRFIKLANQGQIPVAGVWLKPEDDIQELATFLDSIQLIVIDFPVFTDGRGYSQARIARTQLEFAGELRATGDVRTDQILFMIRAGIDTFDFQQKPDDELIEGILTRYSSTYQPSYSLPLAG